jgi:hypothetical protein
MQVVLSEYLLCMALGACCRDFGQENEAPF